MLRDRCLGYRACPVCNVGVAYCGQRVGWVKMPLGTKVGLSPGDILLDGDPASLPRKWAQQLSPTFRLMSVVLIRLQHCGVHGNGRPKQPKSEARRDEKWGYWEGMFPSPPPREYGERCKLCHWGPGRSPATWRCKTFYRLTKPLLVSILLIMAALRNRTGHYIFALWFLVSFLFFSSPNLGGRRVNVYHTSTHGMALV